MSERHQNDDISAQFDKWRSDTLEMLVHKVSKIDMVIEMQRRQEAVLEKLADSVQRLSVIEERQNADRIEMREMSKSISRTFERFGERIDRLEKAEVENQRIRGLVWAAIGTAGAAGMAAILALIGIGKNG